MLNKPNDNGSLISPFPSLNGYQGVLDVFGNVGDYIRNGGTLSLRWGGERIVRLVLPSPNGYQEVLNVFGNIGDYILNDGTLSSRWEREKIVRLALPYSLVLAWNPSVSVAKVAVHHLIASQTLNVFTTFAERGWQMRPECLLFGGAFAYRMKRGANRLSLHSFGIAFDMDPEGYKLRSKKRMPEEIIKVWKDNGFFYGGDFSGRKDPMHFQYAKGV